jgi:hypothetical protein
MPPPPRDHGSNWTVASSAPKFTGAGIFSVRHPCQQHIAMNAESALIIGTTGQHDVCMAHFR